MRLVFAGTPAFAVPSLEALCGAGHSVVRVLTQPDRPAGRGLAAHPSAVKLAAARRGLPVAQPASLRDPTALEALRADTPDLLVVAAYGLILPQAALDIPRLGAINVHASLLPRWRGAAPIQAAIESGDEKTGITVMYMDEGLDTGDVMLGREITITPDDTGGSLHDRLADLAPLALSDAIALLREGRAPRDPQPAEGVTCAGKLTREKGVLDFSTGCNAVARKVRALNPWPAAATTIGGRRLKIFAATPLAKPVLAPGILRARDNGLLIGTGDGCVLVTDVQREGKKRMSAQEFLHGHPIHDGEKAS